IGPQGVREGRTGEGARRRGGVVRHVLAARPAIDRTLQDGRLGVERTDPINRSVEVAHTRKASVMPLAHDAGVRAPIAASDPNPHGGGGSDGQHHKYHEERTEKRPTHVAGSGRPEVNGDAGVNHIAAAPPIGPYTHLKRFTTSQRGYSRGRQRPQEGPSISPSSSGTWSRSTSAARAAGLGRAQT